MRSLLPRVRRCPMTLEVLTAVQIMGQCKRPFRQSNANFPSSAGKKRRPHKISSTLSTTSHLKCSYQAASIRRRRRRSPNTIWGMGAPQMAARTGGPPPHNRPSRKRGSSRSTRTVRKAATARKSLNISSHPAAAARHLPVITNAGPPANTNECRQATLTTNASIHIRTLQLLAFEPAESNTRWWDDGWPEPSPFDGSLDGILGSVPWYVMRRPRDHCAAGMRALGQRLHRLPECKSLQHSLFLTPHIGHSPR